MKKSKSYIKFFAIVLSAITWIFLFTIFFSTSCVGVGIGGTECNGPLANYFPIGLVIIYPALILLLITNAFTLIYKKY